VAALATTGSAADVKLLAPIAASADRDAAAAARSSLVRIAGDDVDGAIAAAIGGAAPGVRAVLIRSLAARGARGCVAAVIERVKDPDASVRLAALEALGALGGAAQTATTVEILKAAKDAKERAAAEKALLAICGRGREKSTEALLSGLRGADAASRCALLRALGRAGGGKALAAVRSATKDKDDQVSDEAVRVLSAWGDLAAAEYLLDLATEAAKASHRVLALRGYVRLAGLQRSNADKLKMLTKAEPLAKKPGEKKLILAGLGNVPTPESLRRILSHLEDAALVEEASAAAVRIARSVAGRDRGLVRLAMTRVLAKAKNRRTRRDAQRMLDRLRK
jgi:HEAT repeat protein